MRRTLLCATVAIAGAFFATGCSSTHIPAFPSDPDPCASYCLVWVPPVYTQVPHVVVEKPSGTAPKTICYDKVSFKECVKPGMYIQKCVPDECRAYGIVEATPAREEWKPVKCKDGCGCGLDNCFKRVHVPASYDWCEKKETEKGFEYCAFTPPEYTIVESKQRCMETTRKYVPPQYRIDYCQELYAPGHYEWQASYCAEPTRCERAVCAPCTSCSKRRPCFEHRPSQD